MMDIYGHPFASAEPELDLGYRTGDAPAITALRVG